jgi:hypothetical protein
MEQVLLAQQAENDKKQRLNQLRDKVILDRGLGVEMESEAY